MSLPVSAHSGGSSLSGGPTMIGMIRARKLAVKIKKRAQFLVAERRRLDNAGKAAVVHRDFPTTLRNDDFLGKSLKNSGKLTPSSRAGSASSRYGYSGVPQLHSQEPKNTYRMDPVNRFSHKQVKDIIEEALYENLYNHSYNAEFCKQMTIKLSEVIKQRVKHLGFSRYKLVCVVYIGQVVNQGMRIGSRCLWNTDYDNSVEGSYLNGNLFAVATVFGAFVE